jgi:hypothetical protein
LGTTITPSALQGLHEFIHGRPAVIAVRHVHRCLGRAADESITVRIGRPVVTRQWTEMDACLRGPGLAPLTAQVLAMVRSVRIG